VNPDDRFHVERPYPCPQPGCEWVVVAEPGDTVLLIARLMARHGQTHGLVGDELHDFLRIAIVLG
jgi:hypothetical protein